jgi:hypothetical protein
MKLVTTENTVATETPSYEKRAFPSVSSVSSAVERWTP